MLNTNTKDYLATFALGITMSLIFFFGLLVVPITDGFVTDTKSFLLLFGAIILGLIYVGRALIHKGFQMVSSPVLLPTAIFGIVTAVSAVVAKPYPVEELMGVGGSWIAWMIIILIGGALLPKNAGKYVVPALAGTGVAITLLAILQLVGFGPAQLLNRAFGLTIPSSLAFSLTSSTLTAIQILVIAATALVGKIISERLRSPINIALLAIVGVGIVLHLWAVRPNGPAPIVLPSFSASWSIMLDSIRSPRTAMIGSGPSSYINNYRIYKPVFVNGTENWSAIFTSAVNTPITLLSTVGIIGFLAWALVTYQIVREARAESKNQLPLSLAILTTVFWFILLPASPVLIGLQALLVVALLAGSHSRPKFHLTALIDKVVLNPMNFGVDGMASTKKAPALPVYALAIVFAVVLLVSFYGVGRAYYALVLSHQATQASLKNDALGLYNNQQAAVRALPYLDSVRRTYAITNLLIASGLSNSEEVTDEQKQQISTLLQQAVTEARAAAYLDPNDATNWQVLAQVYQNMIGIAEDAEQWATQTYVSAIQTAPSDPQLRLALGGVLLNAKQNEQALSVFQQAVNVKPDYANSHYNVAQAYLALEMYDAARQEYEAVLTLLDPATEDFVKATKELEELKKVIEETSPAKESTNNNTNQPTETSNASTPSLLDQQLNTPAEQAVQNTTDDQVAPTLAPTVAPSPAEEVTPADNP